MLEDQENLKRTDTDSPIQMMPLPRVRFPFALEPSFSTIEPPPVARASSPISPNSSSSLSTLPMSLRYYERMKGEDMNDDG